MNSAEVKRSDLDVGQEEGLNVTPLEIVGTVEEAGAASNVHNGELVKPGGNGGFGERSIQLAEDILPNVGDRIQKNTSLLSI